MRALACGRFSLPLEGPGWRPLLMGVINVTPDSFSDGGAHFSAQAAIEHGQALIAEGADLLDIGGESTRPGAAAVSVEQELERVMPVLQGLLAGGVPLSIDTRKPEVMRAALAAGADMINDITGFGDERAVQAIAASRAALCVMHMQGEPSTMQRTPVYRDVVSEVAAFLYGRVQSLEQAGIAADRIVIDPGIGFGKTVAHNLQLLSRLDRLVQTGVPVLVGVSRKSLIGAVTGRATADRLAGSVAAALSAVARGAKIVRVHDVAPMKDALVMWQALQAG